MLPLPWPNTRSGGTLAADTPAAARSASAKRVCLVVMMYTGREEKLMASAVPGKLWAVGSEKRRGEKREGARAGGRERHRAQAAATRGQEPGTWPTSGRTEAWSTKEGDRRRVASNASVEQVRGRGGRGESGWAAQVTNNADSQSPVVRGQRRQGKNTHTDTAAHEKAVGRVNDASDSGSLPTQKTHGPPPPRPLTPSVPASAGGAHKTLPLASTANSLQCQSAPAIGRAQPVSPVTPPAPPQKRTIDSPQSTHPCPQPSTRRGHSQTPQ